MSEGGYDAIVIGSGHNGLTCGAYLAKAGLRVLVLERRSVIGGAAVSEEVVPGFTFSVFSYVMSLLHPRIIRDLELARFGFRVLPATDLYCPLGGGDYIVFSDDTKKTVDQFARFSKNDAAAYPEFLGELNTAAGIMRRLLFETPPDPAKRDWRHFKETASFLWRYREARSDLYRLIDLFSMSADHFLSRWFERTEIRAILAYYASIGTFAGPATPGSAYVILHHLMGVHEGAGGWGFIPGGMGTISKAIAQSGERHGMVVKTDAEIERVIVEDGRVTGVATRSGDEFRAPVVVSNASARILYFDLVGAEHLPDEMVADLGMYRTFSTAFKINVACERPPQYEGFDAGALGADTPAYVHVGPTIDYLEKAYLDARTGTYSERPFITPVVPTTVDDSIAPEGKHVVHMFGGHAPYDLDGKNWDDEKDAFVDNVFKTMEEFAPGWRSDVIDYQALIPKDIEAIINSPHGHIFHGELSLDQLFWKRPVPGYADYRSPLKGLYLCGSSTHPGGGVSGVPGHNAAREILRDLGK